MLTKWSLSPHTPHTERWRSKGKKSQTSRSIRFQFREQDLWWWDKHFTRRLEWESYMSIHFVHVHPLSLWRWGRMSLSQKQGANDLIQDDFSYVNSADRDYYEWVRINAVILLKSDFLQLCIHLNCLFPSFYTDHRKY